MKTFQELGHVERIWKPAVGLLTLKTPSIQEPSDHDSALKNRNIGGRQLKTRTAQNRQKPCSTCTNCPTSLGVTEACCARALTESERLLQFVSKQAEGRNIIKAQSKGRTGLGNAYIHLPSIKELHPQITALRITRKERKKRKKKKINTKPC
ncbi:hypothetical protein VTG60DRAFT_2647 [Thermothelomyces hinnuleus]